MAADSTVFLRRDPATKQWVTVPIADPAEDRLFWFNGSSGLPDYISVGSGLSVSGSAIYSDIQEAPIDGTQYARKDGAWSVVSASNSQIDGGMANSVYGGTSSIDGGGA